MKKLFLGLAVLVMAVASARTAAAVTYTDPPDGISEQAISLNYVQTDQILASSAPNDVDAGDARSLKSAGGKVDHGRHLPTTPVPAALPLFASGLGFLMLFGWRKRLPSRAA